MVCGIKWNTLEKPKTLVMHLQHTILNGVQFPFTFVELLKMNFCYFSLAIKEVPVMLNFPSSSSVRVYLKTLAEL